MAKQFLLLAFSFLVLSNLSAQNRENLQKQIDKIIHYDTEIEYSKTPGFVIGVKAQDSIFFFGYGTVSKEVEKVPNENTIFEIGGLTKSFTASLIGILVAEQQMAYEKPLNDYLPEGEKNEELQNITIDQLVTHTSKLPRMPMEFGVKEREPNNPYAYYTKQDLMSFYKDYIPIQLKKKKRKRRKKKGDKEQYSYGHLNYALLQNAIEKSQNQDFEDILLQKIITPIGLADTRMKLSQEQSERLAQGYTTGGSSTPPWKFQSFQGSEGLKSTAKDLIKFAEAQMGTRSPEYANAFAKTHEGTKKTGLNKKVKVSRGWHIISTNKNYYDIVAHTGNTNGHRAYLAFIKETETAVVILSNSEHGMQNLGYLILSMINNYWKKW